MKGALNLKTTVFTVKSVTYAIKAKKLLLREGISAKLVKTADVGIAQGCAHGIEIPAKDFYTAAAVLRNAGMEYKVYEK